jgi:NAD(P)-dependent dehydrogenase (short-subunit alcohol dehydrogenase family)
MVEMAFGRCAVVTGAAGGIGRAIALRLAPQVERLVMLDRDEALLQESLASVRAIAHDATMVVVDCTSLDDVTNALADHHSIDILVNGVGSSARERATSFATSSPSLWDFVLQISLHSAMVCARAAIPGMQARRYGRIVNISSEAVYRPAPMMSEYAAAKAGVIGFTRALAVEVAGSGVTVNAIAPGLIRTATLDKVPADIIERARGEIPVGRLGEPEEIAHAVEFLTSPEAGYVTGQTLGVNGGRSFS